MGRHVEKSGYDLNFFCLGSFSPLSNLSAPTFFPVGQPYLGLQEDPNISTPANTIEKIPRAVDFIFFCFN